MRRKQTVITLENVNHYTTLNVQEERELESLFERSPSIKQYRLHRTQDDLLRALIDFALNHEGR